jgi:membrane protease YdiL (CAAX protease family)
MQDDYEQQGRDSGADGEALATDFPQQAALPKETADNALPPDEYPFWGWLDAALFAVVLVFSLVVTILMGTGVYAVGLVPMAPALILAQGVGMGVALFMLSRLLRYRYGVGLREALQLKPPQRVLLYCGLGAGTAILVSVLGFVLRISELENPMKDFIRTDLDLLVVAIGATTFGPLFEEMIFRGFLQPLVGKLVGMAAGVMATALLFAVIHGPQYGWHWQHLMVITTAGVVFGVIRWRTASTTAATLAHCTYNLFVVIGAFVQRSQEMGG